MVFPKFVWESPASAGRDLPAFILSSMFHAVKAVDNSGDVSGVGPSNPSTSSGLDAQHDPVVTPFQENEQGEMFRGHLCDYTTFLL